MTSRIIGRIPLDRAALADDLSALRAFPRIEEAYDEFSSGYWKNCSLWNGTGDVGDTTYRDVSGPVVETPYVRDTPYLRKLVYDNVNMDHVAMIRARNLVDAVVAPHRDFVELDRSTEHYFRAFMVLEDNDCAFHADEDGAFQMRAGEVWFLDAAAIHAAINFSSAGRQSLCWDFAFDDAFTDTDIFANPSVANPDISPTWVKRDRPPDDFTDRIAALGNVINGDNFRDILFLLTKMYFRVDAPISHVYDWLVAACETSRNDDLVANAWALRRYMTETRSLNERLMLT